MAGMDEVGKDGRVRAGITTCLLLLFQTQIPAPVLSSLTTPGSADVTVVEGFSVLDLGTAWWSQRLFVSAA